MPTLFSFRLSCLFINCQFEFHKFYHLHHQHLLVHLRQYLHRKYGLRLNSHRLESLFEQLDSLELQHQVYKLRNNLFLDYCSLLLQSNFHLQIYNQNYFLLILHHFRFRLYYNLLLLHCFPVQLNKNYLNFHCCYFHCFWYCKKLVRLKKKQNIIL